MVVENAVKVSIGRRVPDERNPLYIVDELFDVADYCSLCYIENRNFLTLPKHGGKLTYEAIVWNWEQGKTERDENSVRATWN